MGIVGITGISDSRVAAVCADIIKKTGGQFLIVAPTFVRAGKLASDLSFFTDEKICVMPSDEETFVNYEAKNKDALIERLNILKTLAEGERCIVVAPVSQVIKKLPPHDTFLESVSVLKTGGNMNVHLLEEKLTEAGYERVPMVYAKGQYSKRGGIVDIFAPYNELPYRLDFFDDEIESIRLFDPESQRSLKKIDMVSLYPARQIVGGPSIYDDALRKIEKNYADMDERREQLKEAVITRTNMQHLENYIDYFYNSPEYIWDYMKKGTFIIDDPSKAMEKAEAKAKEFRHDFGVFLEKGVVSKADRKYLPSVSDYLKLYSRKKVFFMMPFEKSIKGAETYEETYNIKSRQSMSFNGKMDILERELNMLVEDGYKVTLVLGTEERLANMQDFLDRCGLGKRVWLKSGMLSEGMVFPEEKKCIITDGDIFGIRKYSSKRRRRHTGGEPIKSFSDIGKGDYVVHDSHGIGRFIGIQQLNVRGIKKDYFKIEYAGKDMLYVPVEQMDIVQKYAGADAKVPRINKLAGKEWQNVKAGAKAAVVGMARELLETSAARKEQGGYAFGKDTIWQKEFEESFPYEETPDQLRCIEEIKADMEKQVAMDRLLCGDVGYGKTEVAARAMFKCVAEGKQAVVLVPTTILASQHYHTLKDRFEKFPFSVEMLSRFRTDAQQKKILRDAEKGTVDVIIGTHRLLSGDVRFKDLGLLVIDEEQRFGVRHKEAIKKLRKNVDVLTLSATPIPRTLHMSLMGIRDMSLIEEPPEDRYPVQTYVTEQEDYIIKEAIQRELERGGQVYVIYNRVSGIYRTADMIDRLVPGRKISVGHGRMNETALEDVMLEFIAGGSEILVATTIIESGIDIQNVNTVIVLDADKYGLSQLYQLRGRVGRGNRLAYAYLMHKKNKILSETADKRLRAIKDFTEFGAGFKIAMRDLEIRGAGNLLGSKQHGHMLNVGYEMYLRLLAEAVKALGGETGTPEKEEALVELSVEAVIPQTYIEDEMTRLEIYKKIAGVNDKVSVEEMRHELMDRFGEIPEETENLIKVSHIKSLAENLGIKKVTQKGAKTPDEIIETLTLVQNNENMI